MRLHPEAPLSAASLAAVADSYGLGEPVRSEFIGRGAMGAIHRLTTRMHGRQMFWTVKRAYWNHFAEAALGREVSFTTRCEQAGILAPRSVRRTDGRGFVLTLDDQPDGGSQYRVLAWVEGATGEREDDRTIAPLMEWMARIHNLRVDVKGQNVDDWFVRVGYDWSELAKRLAWTAPDIADIVRVRGADLYALTEFVNSVREPGAAWCHTDIGAENLIWSDGGPQLIDWENSGPLVPHQELGSFVRSLGSRSRARKAYQAYRQAGGPAEITEPTHLASSLAVHLNYLGCQAELLLDPAHPEQHEFAREQAGNAARGLPRIGELNVLIDSLHRRS